MLINENDGLAEDAGIQKEQERMLEKSLSPVKLLLKGSLAECDQFMLEEEKMDEDDDLTGSSQEYLKTKGFKEELAKLMRLLNMFTEPTMFMVLRESVMLTYNFEGIIMIVQSNQHLIHYLLII